MAEPLTDARRAVWKAINAWPTTASAFKRRFDFEAESAGVVEPDPSPSDFPCIRIFPAQVNPVWWTHRDQQWTYALEIKLWVVDWILPPAEKLVRQVIQAVFQAGPGGTCPYVEGVTGQLPTFSNASFDRVRTGKGQKIKAIEATVTLTLKPKFDPLDTTPAMLE